MERPEGINMMRRLSLTIALTCFVVAETMAAEPEPATASASASSSPVTVVEGLSVYPEEIRLDTARDYQSFVAIVRRDDDVTLDVTDSVTWSLADGKFAKIEGRQIRDIACRAIRVMCDRDKPLCATCSLDNRLRGINFKLLYGWWWRRILQRSGLQPL